MGIMGKYTRRLNAYINLKIRKIPKYYAAHLTRYIKINLKK